MNLPPIPEIPEGLSEAAQLGKLVPFIGAGVSMLAGSPSWEAMAEQALLQVVRKNLLSFADYEQLKHLKPRIKISVAESAVQKVNDEINYKAIFEPPDWNKNPLGIQVYSMLDQLSHRFVTTNYDSWLDEPQANIGELFPPDQSQATRSRQLLCKPEDFSYAKFRVPQSVVHLHGSIKNKSSMVLTTRDYIEHYANEGYGGSPTVENQVLTFLETLFKQKTVLFVGYSLDELEILEFVLQKARNQTTEIDLVSHYMLQGFFSFQSALIENLTRYYQEECGIRLLPYLKDNNDHIQLLHVLKRFCRKAPAQAPSMLSDFSDMRSLLK